MNALDTKIITDSSVCPFYAWDCLTLQLPHRDIDIIIRKETQYMMLVTYLLNEMNSINGIRGSRAPYHLDVFEKMAR